MLTYAIHQKNVSKPDEYVGMNDVYFTNGSDYMSYPFEFRNQGTMLLQDRIHRRNFWTTNRGLVIVTPHLTDTVDIAWLEASNKACDVLPYTCKRLASWIVSHKRQLAENETYQRKVLQYYKNCIRIAGGTELSEEHLTLAKDVMNLDWYYDYSDDIRVSRAGKASFERMKQRLEEAKVPGFMKAYSEIFIKR